MSGIKDVGDIVYAYLEKNGYHGLWNPDGECACVLKDLGACDEMSQNCQAGYMAPCDCGDHDFHIVTERPGLNLPITPIEGMPDNKVLVITDAELKAIEHLEQVIRKLRGE